MFTLLLGLLYTLQHQPVSPALLMTGTPVVQAAAVEQALDRSQPLLRQFPAIPIRSYAGIVQSASDGTVLWERHGDVVIPIASISKLMTALVVVSSPIDLEAQVTIDADDNDNVEGSRLYVSVGEKMTVKDLLYTSLVGSANNATKALARSTGLSSEQFTATMNEYARRLGMADTVFVEPTGLDPRNQSTARDLARLAQAAFTHPIIAGALQTTAYEFRTIDQEVYHRIRNTNQLLGDDTPLMGKTGYLDEALYTYLAMPLGHTSPVIVVLLRNPSSADRFSEARELARWGALQQRQTLFTLR